jgi:flagellar basal-body rod modification protein FlgD
MVAGLIGKEVSWVDQTDTGSVEYYGIVNSVVWRDGVQYVKVESTEVPIDKIQSISEPSADNGSEVAGNE